MESQRGEVNIAVELNWLGKSPLGRLSSFEETRYLVYCFMFICMYRTLVRQTLARCDVLKAAGSAALCTGALSCNLFHYLGR